MKENTEIGARLNSFKLVLSKIEGEEAVNLTLALLKQSSQAGLTCADLNFPVHWSNTGTTKLFREHNVKIKKYFAET